MPLKLHRPLAIDRQRRGRSKMSTLYEITSELDSIVNELHQYEQDQLEVPTELAQRLNGLLDQEGEKVDRCCIYITKTDKEIEHLKSHLQVVQSEIKKKERMIEYLKNIALNTMNRRGVRELQGKLGHKFSLRESTSVEIYDTKLLPDTFLKLKEEWQVDKNAVKDAIKSGEQIPGARLSKNLNVQVK